jgi:methionyl aminopeptidase
MIKIKTEKEIELVRGACRIVAALMKELKKYIQPGISTEQLDKETERLLKELGAGSAFKGYRGYPANICTSVNEQVVHGIPGKRRLKEGDIIGLDVGAKLNGYYGDVAWTFPVGKIPEKTRRLLKVGRNALSAGIAEAREGKHLSDISSAIQSNIECFGYSVVRKFVGHGIGEQMHEDPEIPNFGKAGLGPVLKAGMVLAIEPMLNEGDADVEILADKWTAVTKDRKLSAHFEHTICVTRKKAEVLTDWE